MRLWHYKLIPFLPKSQLLAQWRELNSIFKDQPNHILINYVYRYSKSHLLVYTNMITEEMNKRGIKIKNFNNMTDYFYGTPYSSDSGWSGYYYECKYITCSNRLFCLNHDLQYLRQCFYNLQEKYDRGQKDFDKKTYIKLKDFCEKELNQKL